MLPSASRSHGSVDRRVLGRVSQELVRQPESGAQTRVLARAVAVVGEQMPMRSCENVRAVEGDEAGVHAIRNPSRSTFAHNRDRPGRAVVQVC